jgi:hypothetical protein
MKTATIGLDIAKQVFQVQGVGQERGRVFRRKLRRSGTVPGGDGANGSAHCGARTAPQFVRL